MATVGYLVADAGGGVAEDALVKLGWSVSHGLSRNCEEDICLRWGGHSSGHAGRWPSRSH